MRILLVEDDSLFAEIISTFLQSKHCQTDVASCLAQAKRQICDQQYDFIILDNGLPDGKGIDEIQFLKTHCAKPIPVMMITADENQTVMAKAFENGIDDYLVKPLSLDLLWLKILRVHSNFEKSKKLEAQTTRLEAMLSQQQQEEALARHMYEHISSQLENDDKYINTYLQSSSAFNGDFFICDNAPNGNHLLFLVDATGHGLSAAISIIPLINTLKAMIRKGLPLAHIIHEANKKMCSDLPDDKFVAAIGLEINPHSQIVHIFNGGMPDIIAVKEDFSLARFSSASMSLGIMEPEDFEPNVIQISTDGIQNLFFYSDGLIEQENSTGEPFGMARLLEIVANWDAKEHLVSRVINYFSVFNELEELQDDLSLCDVQIKNLISKVECPLTKSSHSKSGNIIASLRLEGGIIADTDIIGAFDNLMRAVDMIGDLRQRAFTVFAELISNALDHGILELDSALKNDVLGFADYIEQKEMRMAKLKRSDKLEMTMKYRRDIEEIEFSIKDSGSGYELENLSTGNDLALSGRGVPLIKKLCKQVDVKPPGNYTSVIIKRDT